jgi:hypothetical protein
MDAGLTDAERQDPEARRPKQWAEFFGNGLDELAAQCDAVYQRPKPGASGQTSS